MNIKKIIISISVTLSVTFILSITGYLFTDTLLPFVFSPILIVILYHYLSKADILNYYLILIPLVIFPMFYNHTVAPNLLVPLNTKTITVLLLSIISLLFAFIFGSKIKQSDRKIILGKKEVLIISFIGFLPFINQLMFGFRYIISGQFNAVRSLASLPILSSLVFFKYLGLFYFMKNKQWKKVIIYEVILFISVLAEFGKTALLSYMLLNLIALTHFGIINKKNIIKFSIIVIPMGVYFLWFFNYHTEVRNDYNIVDNLYQRGIINQNFPKELSMIYLYAMGPLSNLAINVMDVLREFNYSYGYWISYPIVSIFKSASSIFADGNAFNTISFLNTINFSFFPFKDFGYIGSIIINFVLGVIIVSIYKRRNNSILNLLCYAIWLQAGIELFFSNHYMTQTYPLIFLIFTIMYQFIFKSKIRGDNN